MKVFEYGRKPEKIIVLYKKGYYVCDNCYNVGGVYAIRYNQCDYETPDKKISKQVYAKTRYYFLCEECFEELIEAIREVKSR